MSDVLREHITVFGFSHSEIARRATKLNQATAYRVVEGETINPSLNSLTGIIEAITLTDCAVRGRRARGRVCPCASVTRRMRCCSSRRLWMSCFTRSDDSLIPAEVAATPAFSAPSGLPTLSC